MQEKRSKYQEYSENRVLEKNRNHLRQWCNHPMEPNKTTHQMSHKLHLMSSPKGALSVITIDHLENVNPSNECLFWHGKFHSTSLWQATDAYIIQIYCLMKTRSVNVYCCYGTLTSRKVKITHTHPCDISK